jgi:hypothetical protein
MTDSKLSNRPGRLAPRFGPRALLLSTTVALSLVAVPSVAQATALQATALQATALQATALRPAAARPSNNCSRVSAAQVAAIVHHRVPAGTYFSNTVKATKQNDGISGVDQSCIYGSETSLKELAKDVILSYEVTSKPLTQSQLQHGLSQAEALKFKFTPYSGLGMNAFYYTFTIGGTPVQGLAAINGTHIYSAGIYVKAPATSELAALVKLAEDL